MSKYCSEDLPRLCFQMTNSAVKGPMGATYSMSFKDNISQVLLCKKGSVRYDLIVQCLHSTRFKEGS